MEWISVKDRLPDLYQWVLVTNSPTGTNEPRCINIWRWEGEDLGWNGLYTPHANSPTYYDIISDMFYDEVSHWMPLPKPPKVNS